MFAYSQNCANTNLDVSTKTLKNPISLKESWNKILLWLQELLETRWWFVGGFPINRIRKEFSSRNYFSQIINSQLNNGGCSLMAERAVVVSELASELLNSNLERTREFRKTRVRFSSSASRESNVRVRFLQHVNVEWDRRASLCEDSSSALSAK